VAVQFDNIRSPIPQLQSSVVAIIAAAIRYGRDSFVYLLDTPLSRQSARLLLIPNNKKRVTASPIKVFDGTKNVCAAGHRDGNLRRNACDAHDDLSDDFDAQELACFVAKKIFMMVCQIYDCVPEEALDGFTHYGFGV